ncbi:hypothetical protein G9A89_020024 [Geosiphon pyriformis]|nr:hypothetical protein G9A89_020024 [Geosiphon pyriformis]
MSTTEAKLRSLKVADLKELLAKKGLATSGKKEDLIFRLLATEDSISKLTEESNNLNLNNNDNNITNGGGPPENENKNNDTDLFEKEILNAPSDPNSALDGDFDWDDIKLTTDEFNDFGKDAELESLNSPSSPTFSNNSAKDKSVEKSKAELGSTPYDNKKPSITSKSTPNVELAPIQSESEIITKPTGFTCKKITFNASFSAPPKQSSNSDVNAELERRKKRAERFGGQLTETDKKLERASRFGLEVSSPVDSPLKAERPPPLKKTGSNVDDQEKLRKRAERFGLGTENTSSTLSTLSQQNPVSSLNDEERKRLRSQRFGAVNEEDEEEKKKKRAEKFGTGILDKEEEEKKRRRAERFSSETDTGTGTSVAASLGSPTASGSKTIPPASLSSLTDEEKKRKRAERFGRDVADNEPSNKKVKA